MKTIIITSIIITIIIIIIIILNFIFSKSCKVGASWLEVSVAEEHYQFKNLKRPEATSLKEWRQRDEKVSRRGEK